MTPFPTTIPKPLTPQQQLLSWHLRLGHIPFDILKQAAQEGILPPILQKSDNPICPSCQYGKQTKTRWRHSNDYAHIRPASVPGDCVSVDQLVSSVPGYYALSSGNASKKRYKVATVFVDHFSRLGYVHVSESTSAEDAIEAKQAFERYAHSHGVSIKHYHCDNGIFKSKLFRQHFDKSHQTITFCGVNAHHQNGVAE